MLRKLVYKFLCVMLRHVRRNLELFANPPLHDLRQRGAPVGRLPDHGGHFVEREKCRVRRGHDHHLAAQHARGDGRTSCDIGLGHESFIHWINSHTRASGKNVKRNAGTRAKKSHADRNTIFTSSGSSAKNRIFRNSIRRASGVSSGSMRFSPPLARKNSRAIGALAFSPNRASSPANGVPQARYASPSRRT